MKITPLIHFTVFMISYRKRQRTPVKRTHKSTKLLEMLNWELDLTTSATN